MRYIMQYVDISVYTPLWENIKYKEINKLEGFGVWRGLGIQYISQLYSNNILNTFQELQREYSLPQHTFFQYLQLRHTLQAQFKSNDKDDK